MGDFLHQHPGFRAMNVDLGCGRSRIEDRNELVRSQLAAHAHFRVPGAIFTTDDKKFVRFQSSYRQVALLVTVLSEVRRLSSEVDSCQVLLRKYGGQLLNVFHGQQLCDRGKPSGPGFPTAFQ